jgi:hypothetical protein
MATYAATLQVQAAFGFGALDSSPSWTTIAEVQSGSIRRGRPAEFEQFSSGSASLQLVDSTRKFDPLNTSSTYAGSLLPNVPVRVRAIYSGGTYERFYGYVDGWAIDPLRNTSFVNLNATDGFKILSQFTLAPSVYEQVVLDDSPWLYWRLGETDGEVAADSSGNHRDGLYSNSALTRGSSSLVSYTTDKSVTAADAQEVIAKGGADTYLSTVPASYEMWLQTTDGDMTANDHGVFAMIDTVSTNDGRIYIVYSPSNSELYVAPETGAVYTYSVNIEDGNRHHLVVVVSGGAATTYLDNVELTGTTAGSGGGIVGSVAGLWLGVNFHTSPQRPRWIGTIDDVAVYDFALSSTQVADHYEAATNPWDGDSTGTRIGRILDIVGWPAALRAIDTGESLLGPADLAGMNALAYLQLIAQSEQGRLFMSADGKVTFHDAATVRADTSAQVTFSDDGSDTPYLYGSPKYTLDDRLIYNQASVQRKYGLPQTAENAASVATYGPRTRSLSGLLMQTDAQARNLAERIVYRYRNPQTRISGWTVNPQVKPATWADNLGLEVGDHIAFEIQTAGTLSRVTTQLDLEQITESFTPSKYELSYVGSPRDPNSGNYMVWGGTVTGGWGTSVWA